MVARKKPVMAIYRPLDMPVSLHSTTIISAAKKAGGAGT